MKLRGAGEDRYKQVRQRPTDDRGAIIRGEPSVLGVRTCPAFHRRGSSVGGHGGGDEGVGDFLPYTVRSFLCLNEASSELQGWSV